LGCLGVRLPVQVGYLEFGRAEYAVCIGVKGKQNIARNRRLNDWNEPYRRFVESQDETLDE